MNQGKAINLSEVQRAELERWVRSQTQDSRSVRRARIVLFFLSQDFDKKKNRMFCWTELGAKHIGIMQSLLVTCRLHGQGWSMKIR